MVIVAILGRSGSGKSTLEHELEKIGYNRIISYTTRKIRAGEKNHREYHFVTKEQFENLCNAGIIIERAEYNGNYYGAPKPFGNERHVVVVEKDGMRAFKNIYGKQVLAVYLDVAEDEINRRLNTRNNTIDRESRKDADDNKFIGIENEVDIILDGSKSLDELVNTINKAVIKINY